MKATTVVLGYDGSDCAKRALAAAAESVTDGGTVHVVTAYDAPSARDVNQAYAAVPEEFTASIDLLSRPRRNLDDANGVLSDQGITSIAHFVDDDPASAILDIADNVEADLIVVGSRGLGRASRVVRGSVSTKIAHHAQTNFLVIH